MYCPKCKREYESGSKYCSFCEDLSGQPIRLVEDLQQASGLSLNLGDTAIMGGLHMTDSHNVHNEDKSVHNISNVTNVTQVDAQKTELEMLDEKKAIYLKACKRAYEDNLLNPAEEVALEECRIKLGLDKSTANTILKSVRVMSERNASKTELNRIASTKLKRLTDNLQKNEVKALMQQIDTLEPLVNKYEHDELTRKYYLVLAALKSEKCIDLYENTKTDNYWNTFWSYLAYIKSGRISEAEYTLASLDRFTSYPEDNMTVLAAAGALMMGHTDEAKEYLDAVTGEYTPALQRFVDSLYLLLDPDMAKEMGADENTCAFYLVNFFGQKDPKVKAEEERKRKEAEEAKRKAEEEAKRKAKAEEERKRKEAEEKAKREAEARRKAVEEARLKAEAERKKREEEERKRKAEEERRRLAEAKARAEREAREKAEAERKRKEEEAAAEERRRKEAPAWNALQSCSREEIDQYGISVFSVASDNSVTIYYRGYTYSCNKTVIDSINSISDVEPLTRLLEITPDRFLQVKDYRRTNDVEAYLKSNRTTIANASMNIITFCSESDYGKLLRLKLKDNDLFGSYHIKQEMQLLPFCYDANKEALYNIEYQHLYCDVEIYGGVTEILQAGYINGHRDNVEELKSVECDPITKKFSSFEVFSHLLLGAIVQYGLLYSLKWTDQVLLSVLPFDFNAEIWVNGHYRDGLNLMKRMTTIPCKKTKIISDDECTSIVVSFAGMRFALDIRKLFGFIPKSLEITTDIDTRLIIKFEIKDKESKKEITIRQKELFDYELTAEAEKKRIREAEEEKRRAEAKAQAMANVIKKLVDDMVLVEGGFFMMGATPDQDSNVKAEKPVHRVKLNPFRMSRYEVTLEQWAAVMDSNPTKHMDPKRPVTSVSWNDCQEFIKRVNEISSMKFRLPTEAEWEFAARGGNKSKGFKYAGSNNLDEIAWIWKNSGDNPLEEYDKDLVKNNHCRTHDVGQKAPNELGLYDMCGNVWEWCADWYSDYSSSDQDNPKGPSSGKERVQRGGCYSTKNPARVAYRLSGVINEKYANLGFRLASEPTANDLKQLQEEEAKRKAAIKTYNGHECVDLGLPSGTLWATCNIGASKPEEYGNYFAWGETSGYNEGKRDFDDEHYKFRVKKYLGLKWIYTKYVENKKNGNVDNKLSLDKEDDAAHVLWGNGWRMPTTAQIEELINKENTTCEIILQNGIRGFQITSKANGNSIFFPAAGEYTYIFLMSFQTNRWELETGANHLVGETGQYWTRDRLSGPYNSYFDVVSAIRDNREKGHFKLKDHDDCANSLEFYINSDGELKYHVDNNEVRYFGVLYPREIQPRCFGYSIRPVHSKE